MMWVTCQRTSSLFYEYYMYVMDYIRELISYASNGGVFIEILYYTRNYAYVYARRFRHEFLCVKKCIQLTDRQTDTKKRLSYRYARKF